MSVMWLKTGALAGAIALAAGTAFAQSPGQSGTGSQEAPATMDRGLGGSQSNRYVWQMLLANMAEIHLAQIATQRATSADVKAFAQQMVTDHTRANDELKPIAQQRGVPLPTRLDSKDQKVADKLTKAEGSDFDRQFMKAMVDSHRDAVKLTTKIAGGKARSGAATTGTSGSAGAAPGATGTTGSSSGELITGADDLAVAQYAALTLPMVQQHLEQAQSIMQGIRNR